MQSARIWASEEFSRTDLGDARRTRRLVALAGEVAAHPAGTVMRACGSSASREGAFRLLENGAVRVEAVRAAVQEATLRRCSGIVFVPVDATSLHLADRKGTKGLGGVGAWHRGARGVHVMSALAVSGDGKPLGISAQRMWTRAERSRRNPHGKPACGGENGHWLEVLEDCRTAFVDSAPGVTPWYQLDRGGDCWQVLSYAEKARLLLTVRAVHDRRVDSRAEYLWRAVERTRVVATKRVEVSERAPRRVRRRVGGHRRDIMMPSQPRRTARVSIRAATVPVVLSIPGQTITVTFNAVLVREQRSRNDRVEWLLLTTHPIQTRADILEVVRGYTMRWRIEDFHRAWKSGVCHVEDTQLRSRDAIYKWATLLASVATRAMRLTHQARTTPDAPATTELSKLELEALIALRQPKNLGDRVPTLAEAVRWIAELGGYAGPWNGPPGQITVGRGLNDVLIAARAFELRDRSDKS